MDSGDQNSPPDVEEGPTTDEALAATKAALLEFLRVERPREIFYLALMEEMSKPNFNHAVGHVAEVLFDSALAAADFTIAAKEANEWNGVKWTKTNEDLDRIYVHRDGTAYGVAGGLS